MRTGIDIDRGGKLHERVKEYARENGVLLPRAYAELIEAGLAAERDEE